MCDGKVRDGDDQAAIRLTADLLRLVQRRTENPAIGSRILIAALANHLSRNLKGGMTPLEAERFHERLFDRVNQLITARHGATYN